MSARNGAIAIHVDTRGATFPVEVDPLAWLEQQKLTASDGAAFDAFGWSVAVSGGTAVVGASFKKVGSNGQQGGAYVFVQSGNTWSQTQTLTASDGAAGDYFGTSVAMSGGTAVVGAYQKTVGSNTTQGAAYVFVQSGNTWAQTQILTASDGAAGDYFGTSVAVSGGTAVVGAYRKTVGSNTQQGAAYVFVQSGSTWPQTQKLTASDGAANDNFGGSVAVSGGTAVVGAPSKTVGSNSFQGATYVFVQSGNTWAETQKLTASDGAAVDVFGTSVGVSGGTAVVGAYNKTVGSNINQGSAYVFHLGPANGTPCTTPSDCGSGFCVDAFCCDTPCTGLCQACTASLKQSGKDDGTCGPVLLGTNPHKDACPVDLPSTCARDGLCDGTGKCRAYYPFNTTCATTCSAAQQTDSVCDGSGKCLPGGPKTCGNYLCDATKCKTSCTTKDDCATGFVCQGSKCVAPGATCVGNDSHGVDGTILSCPPYRCDASGACRSTCSSVDDCVAPATCDPSAKCVVPAASNSGGCSTSGGSGTTAGITAFLLMGIMTRLRRNRRKRMPVSLS